VEDVQPRCGVTLIVVALVDESLAVGDGQVLVAVVVSGQPGIVTLRADHGSDPESRSDPATQPGACDERRLSSKIGVGQDFSNQDGHGPPVSRASGPLDAEDPAGNHHRHRGPPGSRVTARMMRR